MTATFAFAAMCAVFDPPPLTIDRYRLYDEVGTGGMARVHLAKLTGAEGFARVVAIKRMHPHLANEPALRAMFIDEARLSARIQDPHVVRTLDVIAHDGGVAIVMDYVLGESLARALRGATSPVPAPVAVAIAVDVLRGLHAAHEARDTDGRPLGIVHRDVSPKNILLGKDGVARLIDFGIAKATRRLAVTRTGDTKGTRSYMAPEQEAGGSVSREADLYALGVVLCEMLSGVPPRDGTNDVDDVALASAPSISTELARAVNVALARRPGDRPHTAIAFADDLMRATPPAPRDEVARWLEGVAGDALDMAEERLARVERTTEEAPPAPMVASVPPRVRARTPLVTGVAVAVVLVSSIAIGARSWLARSDRVDSSERAVPTAPDRVPTIVPPVAPASAPAPSSVPLTRTYPPASSPRRRSTNRATCTPPYTFDEAGHKLFDPRCF